ncbi:MAG TPA: four-carbon acid sugar kinase family protein [Bryobacteraceae bacterium]|nr:four-carbon acid sugar kinase family protein [Bryobacteraceae bacterium]HPU71795.1 four-carbon acid sugar kinase family protein [Bryobacteraceae bacterium]
MQILGLADDLTGALEIGAKFAGAGLRTLVTTELTLCPAGWESHEALVIDTETRHVAPEEAAARARTLASAARERGVGIVCKKTDSTLRGNISSELGALLDAFPGTPVLYAPAYPAMGRTVKRGVLFVNGVPVSETAFGREPLNPVRTSHIGELLAPVPVKLMERALAPEGPFVHVYDGESDADIAAVARLLQGVDGVRLAAGPAALAGEIAALVSPGGRRTPAAWPVIADCLVVNGSLHAASRGQVQKALESGWPCVAPGAYRSGWAVLETRESAGERPGVEFAARLGEAVSHTMKRARLEALVVFGGDTAWGVLRALGFSALEPLGEVLPGVPVSQIRAGGRALYLITKAGGFGPPELLGNLRLKLSGESRE